MGDQGSGSSGQTVLAVSSLRDYFREALHDALDHQHVAVEAQTEHYVVNLLTLFSNVVEICNNTDRIGHVDAASMIADGLELR